MEASGPARRVRLCTQMAVEGSRVIISLNSVDRRGRRIEPKVLEAAEGIYSKALEHGVKLLGDPSSSHISAGRSRGKGFARGKDAGSAW